MHKVIDRPDLVRDPKNHAILSTDVSAYHRHREKQRRINGDRREIDLLKNEVATLRNEVRELIDFLKEKR